MTNRKTKFILLIIFFIGIAILLYPFISQYWNSKVQSKSITNYDKMVSEKEAVEYHDIFKSAEDYNQELSNLEFPFIQYKELSNHSNLLNIDNHGMIGYITIDKINEKIPIYHGTSSSVLNMAVGHLNGSSLPVGGSSTHSVLAAHSGLPSTTLFTNLKKMEIGDLFVITVIDRKLTYQVDQIMIVAPDDITKLKIVTGKDYVTLLTCTPYGMNTHRLLVRGSRILDINNISSTNDNKIVITKDAERIDKQIITFVISIFILILYKIINLLKKI